jgi:hypothetical protein
VAFVILFEDLTLSYRSFVAALLGKTAVVRQNSPRKVLVTFKPPHPGTFHAVLRITFSDKARPNDQEFIVERELRGRAVLVHGSSSGGGPSTTMDEEPTGGEGAGIAVSHDFGLEFSVELLRLGEPFAQQTKELIITKSTAHPSIFFKGARVLSRDGTVSRCVHVFLRWLVSYFS